MYRVFTPLDALSVQLSSGVVLFSDQLFFSQHQLEWNFGWQYYSYGERFTGLQNYHANTGYSSFRWSF